MILRHAFSQIHSREFSKSLPTIYISFATFYKYNNNEKLMTIDMRFLLAGIVEILFLRKLMVHILNALI